MRLFVWTIRLARATAKDRARRRFCNLTRFALLERRAAPARADLAPPGHQQISLRRRSRECRHSPPAPATRLPTAPLKIAVFEVFRRRSHPLGRALTEAMPASVESRGESRNADGASWLGIEETRSCLYAIDRSHPTGSMKAGAPGWRKMPF